MILCTVPRVPTRIRVLETTLSTTSSGSIRYEAHESPSYPASLGYGVQFSLIASATLLVTPVIVASASDIGESYVTWMVFASLVVVGLSTLIQVRRIGPVGAGAVLPMFTAAFAIPFCITAVVDGGPKTLMTLVIVTSIIQIVISRWLFLLRRIVTPIVGGTIMMILSITLASVVFDLLDSASQENPEGATLTALATTIIVAALMLRGSATLRLWGPLIGIVGGCIVAVVLGIYEFDRVLDAQWIGLPREIPDLGLDLGINFWTLLPSFLFLGLINSIQVNGASITNQRVAWRDERAIDFREVQRAMAGGGVSNLLAGIGGTVPNVVNPAGASFIQITGVASRRMGYFIGGILLVMAFLPKVSGLISTIPGPVMTGYLIMVTGTLFVDGARTVIQSEPNRQRVVVAGVCFWIGASFQFGLFHLPDLGPVWGALFKSGITTGGIAVVLMILYLELTNPRRMRFQSKLHSDSLPELNEFIAKFADSRGWGDEMKDKLSAVAEETLLTLAPLDLTSFDLDAEDESFDLDADDEEEKQLIVLASSDGPVADLEFIGGGNQENVEDQVRQLQELEIETPAEHEISLRLLQNYASSVNHQQYSGTDVITLRIDHPGERQDDSLTI